MNPVKGKVVIYQLAVIQPTCYQSPASQGELAVISGLAGPIVKHYS